jgi:exopolysaccharide biosynthesis protein
LLISSVGLLVLSLFSTYAGDSITSFPFQGVTIRTETSTNPPTRLFIAEVDLTRPDVRLRVAPGGPDPDGPGKWQTTLMPPTQIAAREHFDLVVNGDFFNARGIKDAEGTNSQYRAATWGAVLGPAVTDGMVWATPRTNRPCLVVHKDRRVDIEMLDRPTPDDWEVVAGNTLLIEHGIAVPHQNKARHPRTAVGLDAKASRLIILVVDGRKPKLAIGMSYDELAAELLRLGCYQAINLDGGGSSVMALREAGTQKFHILNEPTDGRERAVANALGVIFQTR